ncbi:MAG: nickel-dependent lactate racemase [Clostridia bacterium]|nr:nickel-dependent lactate racemase [Clostridia bacterium]
MALLSIPYGKGYIEKEVDFIFEKVNISEEKLPHTNEQEVLRALNEPIGKSLEGFEKAEKVCIVTSDATRPVPNELLIPALAAKLNEIGIKDEQITIMIGTGLHRVCDHPEMEEILGKEITDRFRVVSHDAFDPSKLINLGTTSKGTPIHINKEYYESDLKISLGVIDPHQFAGFSGGAKGVSIGMAGVDLVNTNHFMLTKPGASLGILEGNPLREDIDEIGRVAKLDLIFNVVLNSKKEIVKAVFGDVFLAHKVGVEAAKTALQVAIDKEADVVIASAGGYPKDINMYQAQKALLHSALAVKEGGTVILCAECVEGIGSNLFVETMNLGDTPEKVLEEFAKLPFRVGAHKAFLWAQSLSKAEVIIVSDGISEDEAKILQVKKAKDIDEALEMAKAKISTGLVYSMPKAGSTIPMLAE